jgi:1-deoxy-D-xylulose-5-phosphate reductoisomerase
MEKIAVLGSTGSIGTSGLDVISRFPGRFKVSCLSANSNIELLLKQVKEFKPGSVCVTDRKKSREFKDKCRHKVKVYEGEDGLCEMLENSETDTVLMGIVGAPALKPIITALDSAKKIALANKEALVMAGNIIIDKAMKNKVMIVPVDSEHSAIFQCIGKNNRKDLKRIFLTGSGGPLLRVKQAMFRNITPKQAVSHPRWKMGKKISVDSATMMNKGLEVIEARWLFNMDMDNIEILIHPEAVVHSMVELKDGAVLAQLGVCDMRMPIQYALTYPDRLESEINAPDFSKIRSLNFYRPDLKKFPCINLAYEAGKRGGTYPSVMNASNEIAVKEFIEGRAGFLDIPRAIEKAMKLHRAVKNPGLEEILDADEWARIKTKEIIRCFR